MILSVGVSFICESQIGRAILSTNRQRKVLRTQWCKHERAFSRTLISIKHARRKAVAVLPFSLFTAPVGLSIFPIDFGLQKPRITGRAPTESPTRRPTKYDSSRTDNLNRPNSADWGHSVEQYSRAKKAVSGISSLQRKQRIRHERHAAPPAG